MISRTLQSVFLVAVIAASAAVPWLIHRAAAPDLRNRETRVQELTARLAQLTSDNERLSNLLAGANATALSVDQLTELLRLRSEAGALREQTNALRKLREEIRELQNRAVATPGPTQQKTPAETGAELSAETLDAMRNVCHWLPQALQSFANDHEDKAPSGFSELRNYFPKPEGRRLTGLYTFEFVRDDGPLPGDDLVLREGQARQGPDGRWMRVYGFADGRVVEATSEDREFKSWEKEHLGPASTGRP